MVQAAVDAHTVARIWKFLSDAHYITYRSKDLHLRVPVINRSVRLFSFWHLRVSLSESGRIVGRATITNLPMFSLTDSWSLFDAYVVGCELALVLITLLHALAVSGLLAPCVTYVRNLTQPQRKTVNLMAATVDGGRNQRFSRWFQLLSQLSFVALTIGVFSSMWLTSSATRCVLDSLEKTL
jgi:hypothetical protein